MLVPDQALAKQRELALLGCVGLEQTAQTCRVPSGTEKLEQGLGDGGDEQEAIATAAVSDACRRKAEAKPNVLHIAKALLDRESTAIELGHGASIQIGATRCDTPRFGHSGRVSDDDGGDRRPLFGYLDALELPCSSRLREPFHGRLRFVFVSNLDAIPKADREVPSDSEQPLVKFSVAEPAVSENRDRYVRGDDLPQSLENGVLMLVAPALERALGHRLPDERCGTAVRCDQVRSDGAVVVCIEIGPVERDHGFVSLADDIRNPQREQLPDVQFGVAQQSVHLFHRMLPEQVLGGGQPL